MGRKAFPIKKDYKYKYLIIGTIAVILASKLAYNYLKK